MINNFNITQSDSYKYVWFRTAKCGTRSILQFLENNTDVDLSKYEVQFDNSWKDYFKFAIVRNPWYRLVSCWKNKVIEQKPNKAQFRSTFISHNLP